MKSRIHLPFRLLSAFIATAFSFTSVLSPVYAQGIATLNLPAPGAMVAPSPGFVPVLLKGMTIHPDNPLQFDFIIDSGNTNFQEDRIKTESERLVKYFLASMTIPKDDLWVNLSPYESDRIIPEELGKTELGRDMLAQDYILKQLTASLMYPEKELGKEFWTRIYAKAKEKFGTTEIPIDTFNKVWILPATATVYEHGQTVYIVEAKLRVMLDRDYEAQKGDPRSSMLDARSSSSIKDPESSIETEIVREIILPEIEKEVNEGQNFAPLRQIYHSLILAKWYKETVKNSLLSKIYIDQKKIAGVNIDDATLKDQIYAQYMEAYKKGVFNYIKEDYDRLSNETIPRKYFSGGEELVSIPLSWASKSTSAANLPADKIHQLVRVNINPQKQDASSPILGGPWTLRGAQKILDNPWKYENAQVIKALKIVNASDEKFSSGKALLGRLIDILMSDRDFSVVAKGSLVKFQFNHISQESITEILNLASLLEASRDKWFNSVIYMNGIEEQGREYDGKYYTYDYSWPGHADPDYSEQWRLQLKEAKEAEHLNYEELNLIKNKLKSLKEKIMKVEEEASKGSSSQSRPSGTSQSSSPVEDNKQLSKVGGQKSGDKAIPQKQDASSPVEDRKLPVRSKLTESEQSTKSGLITGIKKYFDVGTIVKRFRLEYAKRQISRTISGLPFNWISYNGYEGTYTMVDLFPAESGAVRLGINLLGDIFYYDNIQADDLNRWARKYGLDEQMRFETFGPIYDEDSEGLISVTLIDTGKEYVINTRDSGASEELREMMFEDLYMPPDKRRIPGLRQLAELVDRVIMGDVNDLKSQVTKITSESVGLISDGNNKEVGDIDPIEDDSSSSPVEASQIIQSIQTEASETQVRGKKIIMFVAAEGWTKGGGQAVVIRDMAKALTENGHMVIVVNPYYNKKDLGVDISLDDGVEVLDYDIPVGMSKMAMKGLYNKIGAVHYIRQKIENDEIQKLINPEIYPQIKIVNKSHPDSLYGYLGAILLSKAGFHIAKGLGIKIDNLHAHDWQAGLATVYLEREYRVKNGYEESFRNTGSLITSHNPDYKGEFQGTAEVLATDPLLRFMLAEGILQPDMVRSEGAVKFVELFNPGRWADYESGKIKVLSTLPPSVMQDVYHGLGYHNNISPGQHSLFQGGALLAQMVVAVSPQNMKEMQTAEGGSGLEGVYQRLNSKGRLKAVNNAIYSTEKPDDMSFLTEQIGDQEFTQFSASDSDEQLVRKRLQNRHALFEKIQQLRGAPVTKDKIFGNLDKEGLEQDLFTVSVGRLVYQKGYQILFQTIDEQGRTLADAIFSMRGKNGEKVRLVLMATPNDDHGKGLEEKFKELAQKYNGQFVYIDMFNLALSKQVVAAGDTFFMPSWREPGGISNREAAAMGLLNFLTRVGGLIDFINEGGTLPEFTVDRFEYSNSASMRNTAQQFAKVLKSALQMKIDNPQRWINEVRKVMQYKQYWEDRVPDYVTIYKLANDLTLSSSPVTREEAARYQENVKRVFQEKDHEAGVMFDPGADPAAYQALLAKNGADKGRALFINAPLGDNPELVAIYRQVQDTVAKRLNQPVVEGANYAILDEIHITAANVEIANTPNTLKLSLESVFQDARGDAQGLSPFEVTLVGPHLMPNGAVVMEYEISDPVFLRIRKAAEARIEQYKTKIGENNAFAPNIYHSTVAVLTDPRIPADTLMALKNDLDALRARIAQNRVTTTVHTMQVSEYRKDNRRMITSQKYVLSSSPVSLSEGDKQVPTAAKAGIAKKPEDPGGIDMNNIDVNRQGAGVDIQFDPAELQELIDAGIDGFAPVIINITPLPSVLPLLGLEPGKNEELEELSRIN